MADKKISQLTGATTPLAGTEELPLVQGGVTKKVSIDNLTAGKAVTALSVEVGAGTVSAPSITTTGDTNTGIYFPAADTIAFTEGGAEVMKLDSSGLELSANDSIVLRLKSTDTGATAGDVLGVVEFYGSDASSAGAGVKSSIKATAQGGGGAASDLRFYTSPGGTNNEERMVIDLSGNVTVSSGNLVIGTSGKGIDFSATAGTGTSELLADYEEGTWTPVYVADTTNFTSVTYDVVLGQYTKIGNVVYINMALRTDAISGGTGAVRVEGLPFAPNQIASATIGDASAFTTNPTRAIFISTNSSIFLYKQTTFNGAVSLLDAADMGTTTNDNLLRLSGFYII